MGVHLSIQQAACGREEGGSEGIRLQKIARCGGQKKETPQEMSRIWDRGNILGSRECCGMPPTRLRAPLGSNVAESPGGVTVPICPLATQNFNSPSFAQCASLTSACPNGGPWG